MPPTDDELVAQGMAIFRGIDGRNRAGLCAKRIARDCVVDPECLAPAREDADRNAELPSD